MCSIRARIFRVYICLCFRCIEQNFMRFPFSIFINFHFFRMCVCARYSTIELTSTVIPTKTHTYFNLFDSHAWSALLLLLVNMIYVCDTNENFFGFKYAYDFHYKNSGNIAIHLLIWSSWCVGIGKNRKKWKFNGKNGKRTSKNL